MAHLMTLLPPEADEAEGRSPEVSGEAEGRSAPVDTPVDTDTFEHGRFSVRWLRHVPIGLIRGWAVYDRGHRITITFPTKGEAYYHLGRIAHLYARWGWDP